MTFQAFYHYFEDIINAPADRHVSPYDKASYIDYTRLNWARMNRWFKTARLSEEFKNTIRQISEAQQWIVITEPWCGDAAHSVPFIELASRENPLITVSYELRDSAPFRIDNYLTNGSKSIPKLIIRDAGGEDLCTWGPRPADCQLIYSRLQKEGADFEQIKTEIQQWYNRNKGIDLQKELAACLACAPPTPA